MDNTHTERQAVTAVPKPARSLMSASLTVKLVGAIGVLVVVGGGAFWYVSVRNDRNNLLENTVAFVSSFSEVVKKSVRNDMLLFRRENIQKTVESVGASESISRVQILDARGTVFYSSDRRYIGQSVQRGSHACAGCHGAPAAEGHKDKRWEIYTDSSGFRILSFVEPIYNEPDCYTAVCHAHPVEQKVLGVLKTDFSLLPMDIKIREQMIKTSIYLLMFLAASGVILYFVLWRFVLLPVRALSGGMERVTSGDLSQRVTAMSQDEIGRLALTFNVMTEELDGARQRMERWNQSLEEEVNRKTEEIRNAQKKVVEAEKLSALGRLTADVAHEIRNPLTALGGYGRRLHRILSSPKEKEYAGIIVSEVKRLEKILRDILTFSREAKLNFERIPVRDTVDDSVMTFAALCEEHDIEIDATHDAELPVFLDTSHARHAVNNLIANAIDAMPNGGRLSVATFLRRLHEVTFVGVQVSDTGTGIPDDQLPFVFEPFYTTKEIGRGTGLGLSISRKVIEEHGGFISAENREEGGFRAGLYFPYQSDEDLRKTPCWEFMQCGRSSGAGQKCPAYPHFGRVCWVVGGTYCEGRAQGAFAQKGEDCRKCAFYAQATAGII